MSSVAVISLYSRNLNWTLKLIEEKIVDKIYIYDHSEIIEDNKFILNNQYYHYEQINFVLNL